MERTTFTLCDETGKPLVDPEGRKLEFAGENAFKRACYASRPRFRRGKMTQGPTQDGKTLHRGQVWLAASEPLKPSGEQFWLLEMGSSFPHASPPWVKSK